MSATTPPPSPLFVPPLSRDEPTFVGWLYPDDTDDSQGIDLGPDPVTLTPIGPDWYPDSEVRCEMGEHEPRPLWVDSEAAVPTCGPCLIELQGPGMGWWTPDPDTA